MSKYDGRTSLDSTLDIDPDAVSYETIIDTITHWIVLYRGSASRQKSLHIPQSVRATVGRSGNYETLCRHDRSDSDATTSTQTEHANARLKPIGAIPKGYYPICRDCRRHFAYSLYADCHE